MSNCITNVCEPELQIGYHVAGKQITAEWNKCTLQTHKQNTWPYFLIIF
jgi:hypothetical protein